LDMSKLYKIILPNQKERDTILSKLRLLPQVLYADPNGLVSPQVGFAEKIKLNNIATWYFCSVC
jgi:hypothetical protein